MTIINSIMDFVIVSFLLVAARGAYGIDEYICDTVEVRSYTQLSRLQNCTHVTGNVVMVFNVLDSNPEYSSEEINNLSFPLRYAVTFDRDFQLFLSPYATFLE